MGGGASFPITRLSKDRIIIVTGASGGLGYEIAKWCAMMGATVIMACRSEQRTRQAIERMNEEFKAEKAKGTADLTDSDTLALEFMQVDCASFKSVVNFTNEFKKSGRKLHVLFLNAGMGYAPYSKTEDGLEMVLQVNYLSQFLMTAKLLPIMKQSGDDCRILLMSSVLHEFADFDIGTMNYTGPPGDFNKNQYYSRSKLYQVMQMFSMVKHLQSFTIAVNILHPGIVSTNFGSERSGMWKCMIPFLRCCMGKNTQDGTVRSIDCATNPKRAGMTGQYFHENKIKTPSATSRSEYKTKQLVLAAQTCQGYGDPDGFEVRIIDDSIGEGVFTTKSFLDGDFLLEYCGDLITNYQRTKILDKQYAEAESGCFMYYFKAKGKLMCIDATNDIFRQGRMVNDAPKGDALHNCDPKVVVVAGVPRLCFFATRDIKRGEELRFDYGVDNLPWRKKSKEKLNDSQARSEEGVNGDSVCASEKNVHCMKCCRDGSKEDVALLRLSEKNVQDCYGGSEGGANKNSTTPAAQKDMQGCRDGSEDGVNEDSACASVKNVQGCRDGSEDGVNEDSACASVKNVLDYYGESEGGANKNSTTTASHKNMQGCRDGSEDGVNEDSACASVKNVLDCYGESEGGANKNSTTTASHKNIQGCRDGSEDGVNEDSACASVQNVLDCYGESEGGANKNSTTTASHKNMQGCRDGSEDGVNEDSACASVQNVLDCYGESEGGANKNSTTTASHKNIQGCRDGSEDGVNEDSACASVQNVLDCYGESEGGANKNSTTTASHKNMQGCRDGSEDGVNEDSACASVQNVLGRTRLRSRFESYTDSERSPEDFSYPSSEVDSEYVQGSESDESTDIEEDYGSMMKKHSKEPIANVSTDMSSAKVVQHITVPVDPSLAPQIVNHERESRTLSTFVPHAQKSYNVIPTKNMSIRSYDKKHSCLYCNVPQSKLPRHLTNKHADEKEVQLYMQEKDEKVKRNMLTKIRNVGNYQHNAKVIRENKGHLMVKYRPPYADDSDEYLPCEFCYGYYKAYELWKHARRCTLAPNSSTNSTKYRRVVTSSRLLLPVNEETSSGLRELLSSLNSDEISRIVKSDRLILKLGEKVFKKHGHDKEQYNMIRTHLRELGRLLKQLRTSSENPNATLWDFIDPVQFKKVVDSTKLISGFSVQTNSYKTPSLALKIGHSLKKCCKIIEGEAIETDDENKMKRSTGFFKLIEMNWTDEVSTHALRTLGERKRNKVKLVPLTNDVKLLNDHLKAKGKDAYGTLEASKSSISAWSDLSRITLTQIILFNRRRQGEVSKMTLSDFKEHHSASEEDISKSLSSFEQKLCKIFRRIEIVGKRGRTVPVILTNEITTWINLLIETRNDVGVDSQNHFIFARPHYSSKGHIRGSDCIREFSEECGAERPNLLRSTKLRFQIATLSQILNLKDHELDLLADFLGHDIRVHREFYRLPEHTLQVAKVSKILMAMESGQITKQAGKRLDEIVLDVDEEIEVEMDDVAECDEDEDEDSSSEMASTSTTTVVNVQEPVVRGEKRKLQKRPWSEAEKTVVFKYFENDIVMNKLPGKRQIDECMRKNTILQKRTWKNIKDCVRNRIQSKKGKHLF